MKRISTLIALLGILSLTTGCADPDKPKAKPDVKVPYYISSGSVLITKLDYELNNGVYKTHEAKKAVLKVFDGDAYSDPLEINIVSHRQPNDFRIGCLVIDDYVYSVIGTETGSVDLYNAKQMDVVLGGIGGLCKINSSYNLSVMTYWEIDDKGNYYYLGAVDLLAKVSSKVTTKDQLIEQLNNLVKQ